MKSKQSYAAPVAKMFKVNLEGGCCQVVSPAGIPPQYPGTGLGEDFDYYEF